ncbi:MAG: c-type cytochrome [Pseudomonadales bacterium]|nr:c-type cytochrome [Pseudomonadales bacterium]
MASNWSAIDDTLDLTFVVTGAVFVIINLFMVYCVVKFKYNKNRRAAYEPENKKLEWWLTGITTVGVVAMLAPGLLVWAEFVTVPEDAVEVEAVGAQWHWSYRLPGADGKLGAVASRHVSDDNPFGMEPDDPAGQDDVLIANSEVHVLLDQPVKFLLRSKDVLHDFAVAQFRVKMDLVPGMVSYLWFTPTVVGDYEVLCEELCGIGHHTMRGMVVVDEQAEYDAWLAKQPTYAQIRARIPGDANAGKIAYTLCSSCHGIQGEGNVSLNAPKLAGQGAWYLRRQLNYYKTGARGTHVDDIFGRQMAPMAATLVDTVSVENVIAYIQTLPDTLPEHTVTGDLDNGKKIYTTCGACHGLSGAGIAQVNAPRAAGMSDWYLVTQLKNFRSGIRGSGKNDMYGIQMRLMAEMLDDNAINDVVAYMNTLNGPYGPSVSAYSGEK